MTVAMWLKSDDDDGGRGEGGWGDRRGGNIYDIFWEKVQKRKLKLTWRKIFDVKWNQFILSLI